MSLPIFPRPLGSTRREEFENGDRARDPKPTGCRDLGDLGTASARGFSLFAKSGRLAVVAGSLCCFSLSIPGVGRLGGGVSGWGAVRAISRGDLKTEEACGFPSVIGCGYIRRFRTGDEQIIFGTRPDLDEERFYEAIFMCVFVHMTSEGVRRPFNKTGPPGGPARASGRVFTASGEGIAGGFRACTAGTGAGDASRSEYAA